VYFEPDAVLPQRRREQRCMSGGEVVHVEILGVYRIHN
jgi:hypothetical protein